MPVQPLVLVVDDDEAVLDLIHSALQLRRYGIVTAATLQEAEAAGQQLGLENLQLVIADIHLTNDPLGQEGYELYQRWTATYPALPFLFISGDPNSKALPAIQSGATSFLAKPFTIPALLDVVHELLSKGKDG